MENGVAHESGRATTRRVSSARLGLAAVSTLAILAAGIGSARAADTFTSPAFTDPDCANVTFDFGGGIEPVLGLTPDMIGSVVGIPVSTQGTPAAQTLVVVEMGQSANQSVVRSFLQTCGLTPATWTQVLKPGDSNPSPAGEATLDLTVVAGLLPANTTLKTATIASGVDFYNALINAGNACGLDGTDWTTWSAGQLDTPDGGCIVTMSYAVFEKSLNDLLSDFGLTPVQQTEWINDVDDILAALAANGVIVIVSSGDEGSGGCRPLTRGKRNEMAPQWPSTSGDVVSVGGTMWAPEGWNGAAATPLDSYTAGATFQPVAWRTWALASDCYWEHTDSGDGADVEWPGMGTTGGESQFVTRPAYQDGVVGVLPSSTGRLSPDIAGLSGWPTWLTPSPNDATSFSFTMGTSAAAPLTAVGLAHVNAALTARGLSRLTNDGGALDVHSVIYNSAFGSAFNDVTDGTSNLWSSDLWTGPTAVTTEAYLRDTIGFLDSSNVPKANTATINGYSAGSGYDLTTGMGVPNFTTLARLLIEAQTPSYDPQGPPPVLQQVPMPSSDSCSDVDDSLYNWGGAGAGGWGRSWARWANAGSGGPVCTRTLIYNSAFGLWVIAR